MSSLTSSGGALLPPPLSFSRPAVVVDNYVEDHLGDLVPLRLADKKHKKLKQPKLAVATARLTFVSCHVKGVVSLTARRCGWGITDEHLGEPGVEPWWLLWGRTRKGRQYDLVVNQGFGFYYLKDVDPDGDGFLGRHTVVEPNDRGVYGIGWDPLSEFDRIVVERAIEQFVKDGGL